MSERRAQTAPLVGDTALPRGGRPAAALMEISTDEPRQAVRGLPVTHPMGHTVHQEPRESRKESEYIYTTRIICKLRVL